VSAGDDIAPGLGPGARFAGADRLAGDIREAAATVVPRLALLASTTTRQAAIV
jgi:hypothetical protein